MTPDTAAVSEPVAHRPEVMASVDSAGTRKRLVIADVTTDEAWISMRVSDLTSLQNWA